MRSQGGWLSLRLLFVIKSLAGKGGGAERVLSLVTSGLADRGHDVAIATFDGADAKSFYRISPKVAWERLGVGDALSKSGPFDVMRQPVALRGLLRSQKPHVAIGFMHSSFIPLGLAAVGTNMPVIASEHTAFDHYRSFGFQGALVRATAPLFAAFTATSDSVRSGFPPAIACRMTVIPNPVVFPDVRPAVVRTDDHVLLSVGGLRQEKGHEVLIDAFSKLAERFPDWTLRIVGDGPCRSKLEQQARDAQLEGRVVFTGTVADVVPEYAGADLFVIPSSYESFGLATAEALAAGVPAVGFADCPGTNEIIDDRVNGLLVSGPDRASALAEGLARLMGNEELRAQFGRAGPAGVAGYSLGAVVDRWEELVTRVGPLPGRRTKG